MQHRIKLVEGAKPFCCPVRRRSPRKEKVERAEMETLLHMGVVEPSTSPWAACNVFVKKKDGSLRVTSDFRELNALTVTKMYPMEDVRATLDWMGTKKVFSIFDLKDGFFQNELEEESREITAIRTIVGLLRYVRVLQGMKSSPAAFQRVFNFTLGSRKRIGILPFMDDVRLGMATVVEHL